MKGRLMKDEGRRAISWYPPRNYCNSFPWNRPSQKDMLYSNHWFKNQSKTFKVDPLAVINRVITSNNRLINGYLESFHPYIYIHMKLFLPLLITWFHMGFFKHETFGGVLCGTVVDRLLGHFEAGVLTLSLITISAEISIPFIISGSICLLKLGKKLSLLCSIFDCVAYVCSVCFVRCVCLFVRLFICSMHDKAKKSFWGTPEFTMQLFIIFFVSRQTCLCIGPNLWSSYHRDTLRLSKR